MDVWLLIYDRSIFGVYRTEAGARRRASRMRETIGGPWKTAVPDPLTLRWYHETEDGRITVLELDHRRIEE